MYTLFNQFEMDEIIIILWSSEVPVECLSPSIRHFNFIQDFIW